MARNSPGATARLMPRSAPHLDVADGECARHILDLDNELPSTRIVACHRAPLKARQRCLTGLATRLTAFRTDDLIARMQIATDDLREIVVV